MIQLHDQLGNSIHLKSAARRIVSLVPSQTELLHHLGLEDEVIGITKFCIHPDEWFRNKNRVGGTKTVDFEKIRVLNPDLIIANKEENTKEEIEQLQKEFTVYVSDIYTFEDALRMMKDVGQLTSKEREAESLINELNNHIQNLPMLQGKVLYFIWREPYMVVGPNAFIGHVIEKVGLTNVIADRSVRYQELSIEEVKELQADYLLLSSEPFPFNQKHLQEMKQFEPSKVLLVDGEIFSWYGSRMLKMKEYFESLKIEH